MAWPQRGSGSLLTAVLALPSNSSLCVLPIGSVHYLTLPFMLNELVMINNDSNQIIKINNNNQIINNNKLNNTCFLLK